MSSKFARQIAAQCWTDPETSGKVMDPLLAEAFAKRVYKFLDSMETAWGIIANASDWHDDRREEWIEAAVRWRDEHWHKVLDVAAGDEETPDEFLDEMLEEVLGDPPQTSFVSTSMYRVNIRGKSNGNETLEWHAYFLHVPSREMLLEAIQQDPDRASAFARDLVVAWPDEFREEVGKRQEHTVYFAHEVVLGTITIIDLGNVWGDIDVRTVVEMPNVAETLAEDIIEALEAQHAARIETIKVILEAGE